MELLVAAVIVSLLTAVAIPTLKRVAVESRKTECLSRMRALGQATLLYTQDQSGRFPRSLHSAGAHGEMGWTASIASYLQVDIRAGAAAWQQAFNRYYRCPEHREDRVSYYSYGLNVHFELTPDGDSYTGSPATWHKVVQVPQPSRTILLAENRPVAYGDHLMCHLWTGVSAARNALAHERHAQMANYLFVDGHVETLSVEKTFDPASGVNLWNPSLAR